jgi:hypothetical protein
MASFKATPPKYKKATATAQGTVDSSGIRPLPAPKAAPTKTFEKTDGRFEIRIISMYAPARVRAEIEIRATRFVSGFV